MARRTGLTDEQIEDAVNKHPLWDVLNDASKNERRDRALYWAPYFVDPEHGVFAIADVVALVAVAEAAQGFVREDDSLLSLQYALDEITPELLKRVKPSTDGT